MEDLYSIPNAPDYKSQVVHGANGAGGWTIVAVLLLGGSAYLGGGTMIGKRTGGAGQGLTTHPHHPRWVALAALVSDGVAFARVGGRERPGGYRQLGGGSAGRLSEESGGKSKHSSSNSSKASSSPDQKRSSSKKKKGGSSGEGEREGERSPPPPPPAKQSSQNEEAAPPAKKGEAVAAAASTASGGGGRWVHVPQ